MIDIMEITDAECDNYINRLVPLLLKKKPTEWTPIADIAYNPKRFVDVVECLATYHFYDDNDGYCIIELNNDATCIRLEPNTIRYSNEWRFRWKFSRK